MPFRHLLPMVAAMKRQRETGRAQEKLLMVGAFRLAMADPKALETTAALSELERQARGGEGEPPRPANVISLDNLRATFRSRGHEEV